MLIYSSTPKYGTLSTDDISDRADSVVLDDKQIGTKPDYYNLLHFDTSTTEKRERKNTTKVSRIAKRRSKTTECFDMTMSLGLSHR